MDFRFQILDLMTNKAIEYHMQACFNPKSKIEEIDNA